jgi:N-acetyltransferase 10
MVDHHVILDLVPVLAGLYFGGRLGGGKSGGGERAGEGGHEEGKESVKLSAVQSSILLAVGLQRKAIEDVEVCLSSLVPSSSHLTSNPSPPLPQKTELSLPVSQALALFTKIIRKITKKLIDIRKEEISASVPLPVPVPSTFQVTAEGMGGREGMREGEGEGMKPLQEELEEFGQEATTALQEKQRAMIDSLDLTQCVFSPPSFVPLPPFLPSSSSSLSLPMYIYLLTEHRYAIDDTSTDWRDVTLGTGNASVVSVKKKEGEGLSLKRKATTGGDEVKTSKTRRGKKAKHR